MESSETGGRRPTFRVTTLGCRVNRADSHTLERELSICGYAPAGRGEVPTVWIVNTCAVTAEGARKSRKAVNRAVASGSRVLVTGCDSTLEEWDSGVERVFCNEEKRDIVTAACPSTGGSSLDWSASGIVRVPLKAQDGCTRYCSYCVVPYLRGTPRSRSVEEVVAEARLLRDAGAGEIVLCGIDLGSYRGESGERLTDLVAILLEDFGDTWLRLSSLEVGDVDDELLDLLAADNVVCRHLHLPMQSGDDGVLSDMNRPYTAGEYVEKVRHIKERLPSAAVTTDVMVGFPTETPDSFRASASTLEELSFSRVHIFPYSPRPGTSAFPLGDPVSAAEKYERARELREIAASNAREFHAGFVGRIIPVLVEAAMKSQPGLLFARSEGFAPVFIEGGKEMIGGKVEARVASSDVEGLRAHLDASALNLEG